MPCTGSGQLGKAGRERHHPPRTKPKGLEEGAGSIQTVPAEEAEQLLSTVPDEQCANNDAQHQQSECHLHLLFEENLFLHSQLGRTDSPPGPVPEHVT
jgi:hypothetical protein